MDITAKIKALNQIYRIYDDFIDKQETACQKKCSTCCTAHVTLTTLEGYQIVEAVVAGENRNVSERVRSQRIENVFRLTSTVNELAELAAAGKELLEDEDNQTEQVCRLLNDDLCPIYPVRPFACRCLVSRRICRKGGYADVDELILSVNTLFLQAIEHVDADGFSGNLVDVLQCMMTEENRERYRQSRLKPDSTPGLIQNRPLRVLMMPPEYRKEIMPVWQAIQQIQI